MKNLCIGLGLLVFQGLLFHNPLMAATAKVTLKVVDDEGKPVAAFPVNAGFYAGDKFQGVTDAKGLFAMEGKAVHWEVNWVLQKGGYYRSQMSYAFKEGVKNDKWQPWNPTVTAVVRQVMNPVPMYVKNVGVIIPATNTTCGYDLMVGDWVKPYGKGDIGDFVFNIVGRHVVSWTDCDGTLSMAFSNEKDGLKMREGIAAGGSVFPWPHMAPEEGYSGTIQMRIGYAPGKGLFETNQTGACYFRVRTVTNEAGKVVSAYYGKIPGPLKFDVREGESGWIGFTYYLNPTPNDRNLEFDPTRNLFHNLKPNEQVTWP